MKRAISPVIAIVVLMLMTVSAAGMAYLTVTMYQDEAQSSSEGGLERLGARARTQVRIESVSEGKIYMRNLGSETLSNPQFYVEGRPLNVSGSSECGSGELCAYTILENVTCEGDCELSMGEDMPVGTKVTVTEEELQPVGAACSSDGECESGSWCSSGFCTACSTVCDNVCESDKCDGFDPDCDASGDPTGVCCGDGDVEGSEVCESDGDCPTPSNNCDTGTQNYTYYSPSTCDSDCLGCTDHASYSVCDSEGSCSEGTQPYCVNCNHCGDGVRNCDETGVDCGGSDCASCTQTLTMFSDGSMEKNASFTGPGTNTTAKIKINKTATISDATLNLRGFYIYNAGSEINYTIDGYGGPYGGTSFGWSVSGGDIDNDGYDELLVGDPGYDDYNQVYPNGAAYVFWGSSTGISDVDNYTVKGGSDEERFGYSVASGNLDGDAYNDFLIGAPWIGSLSSKIHAIWGDIQSSFSSSNSKEIDLFEYGDGKAISSGDLDGDGYGDLLVGAHFYGGSYRGRAYVFWGSSSGISSGDNYTITGNYASEQFGYSVSSGDINGDGYGELLVGASDYGSNSKGRAYVFWGSSTGIDSSDNLTINGEKDYDEFGFSIHSGDINNDGKDELLVGAPFWDTYGDISGESGRAYVFWGNEKGSFSSSDNYTIDAEKIDDSNEQLGYAISSGDVNNDGYEDFIVSSPGYPPLFASDLGRVYIFWGSSTGLDSSNNYTIEGVISDDSFGLSVSSGDVDNDGYEEYFTGADGKVHIFYPTNNFTLNPDLMPGSDQGSSWTYSGFFQGSALDVNITDELNNALTGGCTCAGCFDDGTNCTIDLNITSQTMGIIELTNPSIQYTTG